MLTSKRNILIWFMFISLGLKAQVSDLNFEDDFGNSITLKNSSEITEYLNLDFFIQNINGKQFISNSEKSELKYDFIISDFKKINRNNFKFKITTHPKTDDIETILKHIGGGQIYRLKIRRTKSGIEFKNLEYLNSII